MESLWVVRVDLFFLVKSISLIRHSKFPRHFFIDIDIQANFEKAFWKLEPTLPEDEKDLATATFRSIALNLIERKEPKSPKTLLKSINIPEKAQALLSWISPIIFVCLVKH